MPFLGNCRQTARVADRLLHLLSREPQQDLRPELNRINAGGPRIGSWELEAERWDLLQIEFWLAAMRDPELRAAMARDSEELWEEMGARFGEKFEGAGLRPPFTGVEFAKLVNALGSGLLLQLYIDPGFVDPGLFSRAIRALLGMPPGEPPRSDPGAEAQSTARGDEP